MKDRLANIGIEPTSVPLRGPLAAHASVMCNKTNNINWNLVKKDFVDDGSLRDIYFLNANIDKWQEFIGAIPSSDFNFEYQLDGEQKTLPKKAIKIFEDKEHSHLLILKKEGINFNCHFFIKEEIEFDISPNEVNSQDKLAIVMKFMVYFGDLLNLKVILTPENFQKSPILVKDVGNERISYIDIE